MLEMGLDNCQLWLHSLNCCFLLVNLLFGVEPIPSQTPHEDATQFMAEFQSEYGNQHPDFLITGYDEVRCRKINCSY